MATEKGVARTSLSATGIRTRSAAKKWSIGWVRSGGADFGVFGDFGDFRDFRVFWLFLTFPGPDGFGNHGIEVLQKR